MKKKCMARQTTVPFLFVFQQKEMYNNITAFFITITIYFFLARGISTTRFFCILHKKKFAKT